jgi:hypothetical protein
LVHRGDLWCPIYELQNRIKGSKSRRDSIPSCNKLTNTEESLLAERFLDLDCRGLPAKAAIVKEYANELLAGTNELLAGKV